MHTSHPLSIGSQACPIIGDAPVYQSGTLGVTLSVPFEELNERQPVVFAPQLGSAALSTSPDFPL